jgi:hypothetical protein
MKASCGILAAFAALVSLAAQSSAYGVIEFENFGFDGTYRLVASISNEDTEECTCKLLDKATLFLGANAPLNEEVSVHFRGPLILSQFAYYTASQYTYGELEGNWTRHAYYDALLQTAQNVTFLTAAGTNLSCLGKALTYAGSDGTSQALSLTVLAKDTEIVSDEEFIIFSNVSCQELGALKDCGVYRLGIPAFHGFYGTTKMFLFEFEMPLESHVQKKSVTQYDMPAIWLLNAQIPRTLQYPTNANCLCWALGCGEFDIFEVMNTTESGNLYLTVHDYQGTGDINNGLQAYGYIERDTHATMKGGVAFDLKGNAVVFMSNSTLIDATISAATLNKWIGGAGEKVTDELMLVSSKLSKSKGAAAGLAAGNSVWANVVVGLFSLSYVFL